MCACPILPLLQSLVHIHVDIYTYEPLLSLSFVHSIPNKTKMSIIWIAFDDGRLHALYVHYSEINHKKSINIDYVWRVSHTYSSCTAYEAQGHIPRTRAAARYHSLLWDQFVCNHRYLVMRSHNSHIVNNGMVPQATLYTHIHSLNIFCGMTNGVSPKKEYARGISKERARKRSRLSFSSGHHHHQHNRNIRTKVSDEQKKNGYEKSVEKRHCQTLWWSKAMPNTHTHTK